MQPLECEGMGAGGAVTWPLKFKNPNEQNVQKTMLDTGGGMLNVESCKCTCIREQVKGHRLVLLCG